MYKRNLYKICQGLSINNTTLRYIRRQPESYYDILGLPKNCSSKEIKDAFIRLSKIHHPDKSSGRTDSQGRFVKVLEAYNVLSKPNSRNLYDYRLQQTTESILRHSRRGIEEEPAEFTAGIPKGYGYDNAAFWSNRANTRYRNPHYYGIPGVPRLPNDIIAFGCVIIAFVGAILQFYAIRNSVTFNRAKLLERSEENRKILEEIEKTAQENGLDMQIKLVQNRMKISSATDKD